MRFLDVWRSAAAAQSTCGDVIAGVTTACGARVVRIGAALDDEMVNLLGAATHLLRKKYPVFEADVRRFFAVAGATDSPATRLLRDQIE